MRFLVLVLLACGYAARASVPPSQSFALDQFRRGEASSLETKSPSAINRWSTLRAGAAKTKGCDCHSTLAMKTALSVGLETAGLLAVLRGAGFLSAQSIPVLSTMVGGLPVVEWVAMFLVIFNAPAIKNVIDGGISVASNQILRPNVLPASGDWYGKLAKPWFDPPGWVFPVMWVLISKPTQLWAVSRLMKAASPTAPWRPELAVYCAQLSLGDSWNSVFFGCQRIGLGLVTIGAQWGTLVASALLFRKIDPMAGKLLLPTIGWLAVAVALNSEIYRLNLSKKGRK